MSILFEPEILSHAFLMAQVMAEIGLSIALVGAMCSLLKHPNSKTGIVMLVAIAWFLLADGAYAQTEIEAPFPTVMQNGVPLPDWNKISFDSLPAIEEAGSISIPSEIASQLGFDPSTSWNAGDKLTDVLKTGSVNELGVGQMDMKGIDSLVGQSSPGLPLSQFDPMKLQNITTLNNAVPGLGEFKVGEVQPVTDRINQAISSGQISLSGVGLDAAGDPNNLLGGALGGVGGLGSLNNLKISEAIAQYPQIAGLGFDPQNFDLSKYSFSSIPNLDVTKFQDLEKFQDTFLKGVPGLGKVPLAKFPSPLGEGANPYVARMDVPLGKDEEQRTRTVSGSYQAGFKVPCEKGCEHTELSPIDGSQSKNPISMFANGIAWISGKAQKVEGGFGVLKVVGGGKEPTGRNPYGSVFKQVITKVDPAKGKTNTSMYFRLCRRGNPDLGCTPYIIGPIPFLTYPEKMFVYLGEANAQDDGKGIELGGSNPGSSDPLTAQDGFDTPCGGSGSVASGASKTAISTVDKVAAAFGSKDGAFSTSSGNASRHIPIIMDALAKEGITDRAQVAYVLATVHRETSFVNFTEGSTAMASSGGTAYYGRGYVQLTHKDAYVKATAMLRAKGFNVDLVKNPELAANPKYAAPILAYGMKTGNLYGDGMNLGKCAGGGKIDWVSCRRIVNDGDKASTIAAAAKVYYDALPASTAAPVTGAPAQGSGAQQCQKPDQKPSCPPGQSCPLQHPLPGSILTSPYGWRNGRQHEGIDISSGGGKQVLAADDGVIKEYIPVGGKCGGVISVMHPSRGLETRYLHMDRLIASRGQQVKRGQPIGVEGNQRPGECSFGAHLHYEIRPGGGGAVNPLNYKHQPPLR